MSTPEKQPLFAVLRLGCAMCFIGHGVFGLITKAVWCNYFAVFGIGHEMAYRLMPVVGTADILFGLSLLVYPVRAVAGWLVVWGMVTAALRPLSGEPLAEWFERAGNFGAPLALLLLCAGGPGRQTMFRRLAAPAPDSDRVRQVRRLLQVTVFLLLAGHAWLNLIPKAGLTGQYKTLGFAAPVLVARTAGVIEGVLAVVTLFHPFKTFLLLVLAWKMGTELFYPHYELFEWIERGGSYASVFALWLCLRYSDLAKKPAGLFSISPPLQTTPS